MKLDILAFGAHPDDVELSAGGTLLKHISAGKKAGIVDLTRGELGTRGNAETRMKESAAASERLGLSARENLGLEDGFFHDDKETMLKVVSVIRRYRPEIVLANATSDRHPDHGRAAKLVADACFYSGLRRVETRSDGKAQEAWRPQSVYHYIQDYLLVPSFVVDITQWMEGKMEAVMCFRSQFYRTDADPSEPATAISSPEFLDFLHARAIEFGRRIHAKYAEGFIAARTPGVKSFFDLE